MLTVASWIGRGCSHDWETLESNASLQLLQAQFSDTSRRRPPTAATVWLSAQPHNTSGSQLPTRCTGGWDTESKQISSFGFVLFTLFPFRSLGICFFLTSSCYEGGGSYAYHTRGFQKAGTLIPQALGRKENLLQDEPCFESHSFIT